MSLPLLLSVGPALLACLASTFAIEGLLRPRVRPFWRRSPATLAIHLGSTTLLFSLCLLVLQRPWFAAVVLASLLMVIVQASNTKTRTLREPFLCQDFEYFLDALRHPRLYVPFFGIGLAVASLAAGALAIGALLILETSLPSRVGTGVFLQAALLPALLSVPLLWLGVRQLPEPSLAPQEDLARLGLLAALWAYGRAARRPLVTAEGATPLAGGTAPSPPTQPLPNLVVVQSESFFDPRPWYAPIDPQVLSQYDALVAQAIAHGPLRVPAWGANTVRTECAFLTGLSPSALGIHRFEPYRQLARQPVPNLAARLRALGYRTVCVHPYPASFYRRDRVMPALGFENFLDISDFTTAPRDGQYIADLAVADKVGSLLKDSDNRPLFVFAITMENHGPLHLERPVPHETSGLLQAQGPRLPRGCEDLLVYLRHLRNADRMIARLQRQLIEHSRHGILCWYGDHVPILDKVYQQLGEPDGTTRYAIWSSRSAPPTARPARTLGIEQLASQLLEAVLVPAPQVQKRRHANSDNHDNVGQSQSHQEQE